MRAVRPGPEAVHVDIIKRECKGKVYSYALLRQSYREDGKVKHRTLANLSSLPPEMVQTMRAALKGQQVGVVGEDWNIERALPHGHVRAVLGCLRQLGLDRALAGEPGRERELALAMIVSRVLNPCSKLATSRSWEDSTLAGSLGVEDADEDDLYEAMDWLLGRQPGWEAWTGPDRVRSAHQQRWLPGGSRGLQGERWGPEHGGEPGEQDQG